MKVFLLGVRVLVMVSAAVATTLDAAIPVTLFQETGGAAGQIPPQYLGLADNSVFWWRFGSANESKADAVLRWQAAPTYKFFPWLQPHATATQTVLDQAAGLSSATRDDSYFYFIYANTLYRKAVNGGASDSASEIPPTGLEPLNFTLDAVALWQGTLYYALDAPLAGGAHQFQVWTYNPASQLQSLLLAANGPAIQRMLFFTYHPDTPLGRAGGMRVGLFLLGTDWTLMRYDLGLGSPVATLNTAIVDFALQNRSTVFPINSFTLLYAIKQVPTGGGPLGGTLNALYVLNPNTGGGTQQAVEPSLPLASQPQARSVATDSRFVFAALDEGGTVSLKAYDSQAGGPAWYFIANGLPGPVNTMASDGNWLYFNNDNLVQKLATDTPPLQLDVQVLGLEAVQVVQNLNNDLPLIAAKPAYVLMYANLATNTTGVTTWAPSAALHGFLGGVEFPDSPIYPTLIPRLTANATLGSLRASPTGAYLFEVPPGWVQPGQLSFTGTVDPEHRLPESGPLANNSISKSVMVLPARTPSLVFVPLANSLPNYDPNHDPDFGDIIARGKSLLPVSDFKIFLNSGTVFKKTFRIRTGRQVCAPVLGCFSSPLPLPGIDDDLFEVPNDQDLFILWTAFYSTFNPQPPGASDLHWIGTFNQNAQVFNGIGGIGGMTLADLVDGLPAPIHDIVNLSTPADRTAVITMRTDFGNDPAKNPWSSFRGGQNLAHELGHNYGRGHINQTIPQRFTSCGTAAPLGPYNTYPYDPCSLGATDYNDPAAFFGFDSMNWAPVPPDQAGDLMSYANSTWTSDFTWRALVSSIPAPGGPVAKTPPPPPIDLASLSLTLLSGHLSWGRQAVQLLPAYTLPATAFDTNQALSFLNALAATPADYPLMVRLRDQDGGLLASYPLLLHPGADGSAGEYNFTELVPFTNGTRRLQIEQLGIVIADHLVSPSAPVLALGTPVVDTQSVTLSWTASDANGDFLTFAIQYSPDDGGTWLTLDPVFDGATYTADSRRLPGGDAARMRVIASDGFNSTIATTPPFLIAKHAPEPIIAGAREGQQLAFGAMNLLHGLAMDAEDGSLPAASLAWSIAGTATPVATFGGDRVSLVGWPPGVYTATLQATDSDGQTGATVRHFQIGPVTVPETAAPSFDGLAQDPAYAQAPTVRLPLGGGQFARVNLIHAGGSLYASFADLPYAPSGTPPLQAGLWIDATGAPGSAPQTTDLGFLVDENGVPYRQAGNGTTMAPLLSGPLGFAAVISPGITSWSAEFRLPDTLVGGWNHPAAVMLSLQGAAGANWPLAADANTPSSWVAAAFGAVPSPAAQPPVADAGASQTYNVADARTICLDGSGSYDPAGAPLAFSWTQTSGPPVTLSNSLGQVASFVATPDLAPATLGFQLVVSNGVTNSSPAQTTATLQAIVPQPSVAGANSLPGTLAAAPGGSAYGGFTFSSPAGPTAIIQASQDLTNWIAIATNSLDYFQRIAFLDPDAALYPQRFYRAVSAAQSSTARAGWALAFNGSNSVVQVADAPALDAFPLTVTFWLKTTAPGANALGLVTKYADATFNGYSLFLSSGHVRGWYFRDGANYVWNGALGLDSGVVADGRWHHLAMVVDEASARLYLDGAVVSTNEWTGSPGPTTTTQPLQFGRYANYPVAFQGTMDEVTLWNRALSEAEINAGMNHSLQGTEAGLVGYWRFDEGAGATTADSTGNGQDGTLQNEPLWVPSDAPVFP